MNTNLFVAPDDPSFVRIRVHWRRRFFSRQFPTREADLPQWPPVAIR
jgi:hypothetical protein